MPMPIAICTQQEILDLHAAGYTIAGIVRDLHLARGTVRAVILRGEATSDRAPNNFLQPTRPPSRKAEPSKEERAEIEQRREAILQRAIAARRFPSQKDRDSLAGGDCR